MGKRNIKTFGKGSSGSSSTGTTTQVFTPGVAIKPKPKKERGYGQASDGRTRKVHGGKVMPQAKSN